MERGVEMDRLSFTVGGKGLQRLGAAIDHLEPNGED